MPTTWTQLAICLPFAAALGILATHRWPNLREAVSIAAGALLFGIVALALYEPVLSGQAIDIRLFTVVSGIEFAFRPEPMGLLFALIASFLWPVTIVYAIGYMRGHGEQNQTRFYCLFAVAIGAVMGIAFAENLFTLFIFYEVLTLCTYPLVTHAGTDKAKQGGRVYLGILLTTSIAFFLLGCRQPVVHPRRPVIVTGLAASFVGNPGAVRTRNRQGRGDAISPLAAIGNGGANPGQRTVARRCRGQGRRVHAA